jgi:hypothetical protein
VPRAAPLDRHRHAEPRTKRDEGPRFDRVPRDESEPEALRQRGHGQVRFEQGELVADALPRPGAERQIGELRTVGAALRQEAIRIEAVRIGPMRRKAMQDVRHQEREPAARQPIAAHLVVAERLAREPPCRRIQPHRFVDDPARERQVRQIVVGRRPPAQDRVDLALQPLTHGCVL